jgi:hypothetical protein
MKFDIASLPGDGIGPEVAASIKPVLDKVGSLFSHQFSIEEYLIGGAAIDATGNALPEQALMACKNADAVFLAAIGGPKWDNSQTRPEQGLLKLRSELSVYANIRPLTMYSELESASLLSCVAVIKPLKKPPPVQVPAPAASGSQVAVVEVRLTRVDQMAALAAAPSTVATVVGASIPNLVSVAEALAPRW